jgi:hypothetical protein
MRVGLSDDLSAIWNAGYRGDWASKTRYEPGDGVTTNQRLAGWIAFGATKNVEPTFDNPEWALLWASCGPGPIGPPGGRGITEGNTSS